MKLQLMNGKQYFLCLPNQIVKAKGWSKGDSIGVRINSKGQIILVGKENGY